MNTNHPVEHPVKHPKLTRDQLHLKRLTIIDPDDPDGPPCSGYLEAGLMRYDGRYVLLFNQDPTLSRVQGGTPFIQTGNSLNQSTVDKIRIREENDSVEDCDLVCIMSRLLDA